MKNSKMNSHLFLIKTGQINIDNEERTIKSFLERNLGNNFCQFVAARSVCSKNQILFALEQSLDAAQKQIAFSQKPHIEFLIRLFGTKQIEQVLEKLPKAKGKQQIVLACASKTQKELEKLFADSKKILSFTEKNFALGKNKKELMEIYGIASRQLQSLKGQKDSLEKLIIEKNSLVVFES